MRYGLTLVSAVTMASVLAGCVVAPAPYESQPEYAASTDQITSPPPPIPVYDQPACPVAGYIWTPGIWQWGPEGYFWVPGTWIAPPAVGLLWTPGFWALAGGLYLFHAGYWGPHVGFYGGINYGFGYVGTGYAGGRWVNNEFHYNTAVTNINNTVIRNTYNQTVINNINVTNTTVTRVSYAGGPGTRSAPTADEAAAAREAHTPPTGAQVQHTMTARSNPVLAANRNEGRPPIAATANAHEFSGAGVMSAKPIGAAYRPTSPPVARNTQSGPFVHARDIPAPSAGQSEAAAEQEQLHGRQEQERQTLSQQQEREHENFPSQSSHDHQAYEAMERQHQQQTSQMQQRHQQEREQVSRSRPR